MCLITSNNTSYIAERDIICYKVLNGRYTPYRNIKVNILQLLGLMPFKAEGFIDIYPNVFGYIIEGGMIHTFVNENEAIDANAYHIKDRVYKCIIPKGTEYFISSDKEEYCSKKIKFVKRIY